MWWVIMRPSTYRVTGVLLTISFFLRCITLSRWNLLTVRKPVVSGFNENLKTARLHQPKECERWRIKNNLRTKFSPDKRVKFSKRIKISEEVLTWLKGLCSNTHFLYSVDAGQLRAFQRLQGEKSRPITDNINGWLSSVQDELEMVFCTRKNVQEPGTVTGRKCGAIKRRGSVKKEKEVQDLAPDVTVAFIGP